MLLVRLQAYAIGGSNYVKLRDVGQTVGFNVYWDGAVYIDTTAPYTGTAPAGQTSAPATTPAPAQSGYTISTGHWSREDFSRQANPAVFTGVYDRDLYNAIRQTLTDLGTDNSAGDRCAYTMVSKEDYGAVKRMLSWWKEELPSEEEYQTARGNLDRAGWEVDYIITHCCPTSVQDELSGGFYQADALTDFLDEVTRRCKFRYHVFGHYHMDRIIQKKYVLLYEQIIRLKL